MTPLPIGIAAGLFIGKQIGVFGAIWAADRVGLARKPAVLRWTHIYGAALLCGVGFTMSLFIGELAFTERFLIDEAKIGTLLGSLAVGITGYIVLALAKPIGRSQRDRDEAAEIFGEDADEDPTVCNDPYAPPPLSPPLILASCATPPAARDGPVRRRPRLCRAADGDRRKGTRLYRRLLRRSRAQDRGPGAGRAAAIFPPLPPASRRFVAGCPHLSGRRTRAERAFLTAQLTAAATRLRMLSGEKLPFVAEAEGLFGVRPELKPLASYDPILARIEALVPGTGTLADRVEAYQNRFTIPRDKLEPVFRNAIAACRTATTEHIALPPSERFDLAFVTGKSWSGYNYYLGDYKSRIEVNTDLPIRLNRAIDLGCHEGYPGHHVLNALLEERLVRGKGWVEFSVYPLFFAAIPAGRGVGQLRHRPRLPGRAQSPLRGRRAGAARRAAMRRKSAVTSSSAS